MPCLTRLAVPATWILILADSQLRDARHLAIGSALVAAVLLPISDGFVKSLAVVYPIIMIAWVRHGVIAMVIGVTTVRTWRSIRPRAPTMQLIRAMLMLTTTLLYYQGLKFLPLAESTAIMFLSPLFAIVIAHYWLRERPDRQTWTAIAVSLIGIVMIVRPGSAMFVPASLLPFAAAVGLGTFLVTTRWLAKHDRPAVTAFYSSLVVFLASTIVIPWYWMTPKGPTDLGYFLAAGLFGAAGQVLTAIAYRHGPTRQVAPIGYLSIVVAVVVGWLAFGSSPDALCVAGMILIIATGTFVARRRSGL